MRVWLAMLGLLGGLLAPAPVTAECCRAHQAPLAIAAEGPSAHSCCAPANQSEPQPAPSEDGRCKCPRPCCLTPPSVATVRPGEPEVWADPLVGMAPLPVSGARSAEYHLKLVRPPRA